MPYDYDALRGQILKRLEKELKPKRLFHTLSVEATAVALAVVHHENVQDASLAGLLHDMAKNREKESLLSLIRNSELSDFYGDLRPYPQLLHAFGGAELVRKEYPELSENIINSIRFHTTGKPAMGTLEKIIFTADYIEPGRQSFHGLEEARELVFHDLDDGVLLILSQTIAYLEENQDGAACYPLTRDAYRYYEEKLKLRN